MRINKSAFVFIAIIGLLLPVPLVIAQQAQSQPPKQEAQPRVQLEAVLQ